MTETQPVPLWRRVLRHPATAWIILLLSFVLTGLAWYISDSAVRKRAAERFQFQAQDVANAIIKRMLDYEMVLRGGAALFDASEDVSREEWRAYVDRLQLQRLYPGIQGLGYSRMIQPGELNSITRGVRAEGFPDFVVKPVGERDAYSAILYLEPFNWRNQRAFGYDMFSEPTRREAMEKARDTGEPALSGRVTLIQETRADAQYGFLMYMPVYKKGMPVGTVAERRAALRGFVYSPFRIKDLMRGILSADQGGILFEIYDSATPTRQSLLFNSVDSQAPVYTPGAETGWLHGLRQVTIAGHGWSVFLYARPDYLSGTEENLPLLVAAAGVTVDVLLFMIIGALSRQQKRAERLATQITARLAESEARYRALFEKAKAPMLLIDPAAGSIVEANDAAAAFYGYERARLAGMRLADINELPAEALQAEMRLAERESRDCFYFSHRLANGETRRVEVRSGPLHLNDRQLLFSIVFDVTQRWRVEEAKQRQLSSLRALNEVQSIRSMSLAEQLRAALVVGSRLFGLEYGVISRAEGDRYTVVSQVSPPGTLRDGQAFPLSETYCSITLDRAGVFAIHHMGASADNGHSCYQNGRLETYIGTTVQVNGLGYGTVSFCSSVPYGREFDEGDREFMTLLANWVGSTIERAEVAGRLAESELRLKTIFETEPECVQVLDIEGHLLQLNQAGLAVLQAKAPEDVIGRPLLDFVAPESHPTCVEMQARVLSGAMAVAEYEVVGRYGGRCWHETHAVPLRDTQGAIIGQLGVARDVTERRRTAAELLAAKNAAEAASLAKSQFLATMSHEIRTPMNGILGMAQLMLLQKGNPAAMAEYAQTLLASGQTLMAILNDILDLSKVEAGRMELMPADFSPAEMIADLRALFSEPATHKGLGLEAAWKGEPGARYLADPIRLRQMLSNLVSNAIKFTHRGGIRIEAWEGSQDELGVELCFSVADDGIGIPAAMLGKLFEPFTQVDGSLTRSYGGTGLGLSIVRSLARLMGGDVGVESRENEGSRFWFSVRAQPSNLSAFGQTPAAPVEPEASPSASGLAGRRVLFVEDNPVNARVIDGFLRRMGLETSLAENGRIALDALLANQIPDLILMDCQMPVMNGYEATQALRIWENQTNRRRIPVIALTANAYETDRQACLAAGMDDYLSKPVEWERLQAKLAQWLG
ncbi:MAG TPA: CHASE domain-containing protein [Thiobacillaceae bacterium]|nr:CHASE domain-containing protein [Thiobacillaceae bacterium]